MWIVLPIVEQWWSIGAAVLLWFVFWPFFAPRPREGVYYPQRMRRFKSRSAMGIVFEILLYLVLSGLAAALGWVFQARRILLGDGDIFQHWYETASGWMPEPHAPLDQWIRQMVLPRWHEWSGLPMLELYRLYSCFTLALLVGGSLLLTRRINSRRRFVLLGLLWTSGIVQLGCGYLEIYPLATCLAVLMLLAALRCWEQGTGLMGVVVPAGLACLAGAWMVMLLPVVTVLVWHLQRRRSTGVRLLHAMAISAIPVLFLIGGMFLLAEPHDRLAAWNKLVAFEIAPFTSAVSATGIPGLFSAQHLLDSLGVLLLLVPALPIVLLRILPAILCGNPRYWLRRNRFLLAGTILPLLFIFLRDPLGGMPRDWDLFAFAAPPIAVLTACWLWTLPRRAGGWVWAALLIQLVVTGNWVALNHALEHFPKTIQRLEGWEVRSLISPNDQLQIVASWREGPLWAMVDRQGTLYREPQEGARPRVVTVPKESLQAVAATPIQGGYCVLERDGSVVRIDDDGAMEHYPAIPLGNGYLKWLVPKVRTVLAVNQGERLVVVDSWNRLFEIEAQSQTGEWTVEKPFRFAEAVGLQQTPEGRLRLFDRVGRIQTIVPDMETGTADYDAYRVPDSIVANIAAVVFGPAGEAIWVHQSGRIEVEGNRRVYDTRNIERRWIEVIAAAYEVDDSITLFDTWGRHYNVKAASNVEIYEELVRTKERRRQPWAAMNVLISAVDNFPDLKGRFISLAKDALVNQLAGTKVFTPVQVAPFATRLTVGADGVPLLCDRWGRVFVQRDGAWRLDSAAEPPRMDDLTCDGAHVWAIDRQANVLRLDNIGGSYGRPQLEWIQSDIVPVSGTVEADPVAGRWRLAISAGQRITVLDTTTRILYEKSEGVWREPQPIERWLIDVDRPLISSGEDRTYLLDIRGHVLVPQPDGGFETLAGFDFGLGGARAVAAAEPHAYVVDLFGGVHDTRGNGDVLPNSPYVAIDLFADAVLDPKSGELVLLTKNGALERVQLIME